MKAFVQGQTTRVWPSGDSWLPTQGSLQRKDYASFSPWFPKAHITHAITYVVLLLSQLAFGGKKSKYI